MRWAEESDSSAGGGVGLEPGDGGMVSCRQAQETVNASEGVRRRDLGVSLPQASNGGSYTSHCMHSVALCACSDRLFFQSAPA